ncbi:MAG: SdpI family protein [Candidatus Micrarchaeota archaeon]
MGTAKAISVAAIAAAVLIGILYYGMLPAKSVTHWNAYGEPDGYGGREMAAFFAPALMAALFALFWALPKIDPFRHNYLAFEKEYDGFVAVLLGFMLYVHIAMIAFNMGVAFRIGQAVTLGIAAMFYYLGMILPRIRRNFFFGIRTPWTLMSDHAWRKTHELGGLTFRLNAIIMLVGIAFPHLFLPIVIIPMLLNLLGLTAYSYLEYRKTNKYKPR